jgi:hypothetical protein
MPRVLASLFAAFAVASAITAFRAAGDYAPPATGAAPGNGPVSLFDSRFLLGGAPHSFTGEFRPQALIRSLSPELELKLREAKTVLGQKLQAGTWQAELPEATVAASASPAAAIPLPRSRPVMASQDLLASRPAPVDDRNLLQKLSDLIPGHVTLASLAPGGGMIGDAPDLASLGYDDVTAVYDISAHTVYLPNGARLEAHSGFGSLKDDPRHVSERNVGATPPALYELKPRERVFHGVQALRMIPADGDATLGRAGLLAHSYMLGPNGDSNGCVSIRDYDKFLASFQNGEIRRLAVVPSLAEAARRSPMKS